MWVLFDLIYLFVAAGVVQGITLVLLLWQTSRAERSSHLLGILTFAACIGAGMELARAADWLVQVPHLYGLTTPLNFAYGPLFYLAVRGRCTAEPLQLRDVVHGFGAIFCAIVLAPIYGLSAAEKAAMIQREVVPIPWLACAQIVHLCAYWTCGLYRYRRYGSDHRRQRSPHRGAIVDVVLGIWAWGGTMVIAAGVAKAWIRNPAQVPSWTPAAIAGLLLTVAVYALYRRLGMALPAASLAELERSLRVPASMLEHTMRSPSLSPASARAVSAMTVSTRTGSAMTVSATTGSAAAVSTRTGSAMTVSATSMSASTKHSATADLTQLRFPHNGYRMACAGDVSAKASGVVKRDPPARSSAGRLQPPQPLGRLRLAISEYEAEDCVSTGGTGPRETRRRARRVPDHPGDRDPSLPLQKHRDHQDQPAGPFAAGAMRTEAAGAGTVDDVGKVDNKYARSGLKPERAQRIAAALEDVMRSQKPYRDGALTLSGLAKLVPTRSEWLSQVLNECLRQNFFQYINHYRIAEAKRLLAVTSGRPDILAVAYQVGFNAKSTFYKAFKQETGLTPAQYWQDWLANRRNGGGFGDQKR